MLVRCLLNLGANANCSNYGGFTPYHLTYGRQNEEIRCQLYEKTPQELRELPDSESDESDMEDVDLSEDEVSFSLRGSRELKISHISGFKSRDPNAFLFLAYSCMMT